MHYYKSGRDIKTQVSNGKLSYQDSAERIITSSFRANGITIHKDYRLAIVTPTQTYRPVKSDVQILNYVTSPSIILKALQKISGLVVIDLETNGLRAHQSTTQIVGLGLATDSTILYFDFATNTTECNQTVLEWLRDSDCEFVAHNMTFDAAFLLRDIGWLNWKYCTYALYRQLANEGYNGQSWGLKLAQKQLLGWNETGEVELDNWLLKNGHNKGNSKTVPDKSKMYLAPAEILGYYCGLDCASTYMLLTDVLLPSIKGKPWEQNVLDYHRVFVNTTKVLAKQQLSGITVDHTMVKEHLNFLHLSIESSKLAFLNHPDVAPLVQEYNEDRRNELKEKEPEKFKKRKVPKEPKQFKKNGEVSKSWLNWHGKMTELANTEPEVRQDWLNWFEKWNNGEFPRFNINSGKQLEWLFYEKLGYPILIRTDTGEPSTGVRALPGFGELGKLLESNKNLEKEKGYVEGCIENLLEDAEGHHRIHPTFRNPGTLTCRLAGSGGINIQQLPKSKGYLECWKPVKGKAWLDCDHKALEQVVLAELSKDESLWKIYGPGAPDNDVYIFNGALMAREFGVSLFQPFLDAGYNPENPDPAIIAKIKKEHKGLRSISKVASLGKAYGMGAPKFQLNMKLQGIDMSLEEAQRVVKGLDEVYAGTKRFQFELEKQWNENNGWVLNGIGRPVCVEKGLLKDVVNRVVQSTGHDIHMVYIDILDQLFAEHELDVKWIVSDFHDQTIVECDEADKELVYRLIGTDAYELLNGWLDGEIPLEGDPQHISTLADAKCE